MKFTQFILESKDSHAVMAFGRMAPPTSGHSKLVDKVKDVAKEVGGSHHVILSHTQDSKKNPLPADIKLKHAKRFFPDTNITTSDKEHPTFLHHAAKLHKQGVTHLHMVAGSDRTEEYKKKLAQYNGTHKEALYNFKKITVHSAGQRDPDAEGVEGMSASKMRAHASSGNYKEFKKGVPNHVPEHHAKELYNDVRHHMGVKEGLDTKFEHLLYEGVHDKAIFKAVFLAGGPGSGKDYVLDNTLAGHGLTEINSDKALEYLMDKKGLDKTMPASEKIERDLARGKSKSVTELRERLALHGRNGVIINGTGDDPDKIKKIKERLEELGYDTSMVLVNTKDEVSALRNVERGQRGGRTVPEDIRKEKWQSVQNARPELGKIFGDKYIEFENSENLRSASPEIVKAKKDELLNIFKQIQKFVNAPPKSKQAKEWVATELDKKDTLKVSQKDTGTSPHPDSKASEEARQLGLDYYGFGRYGKNSIVTHRSVHDKLQPVQAPVTKTSNNVNEEFEIFLENKDILDKDKLLKDNNGKVRTFTLRRAAAKEAHLRDGTVYPMGNGYVIKLKESLHVEENSELVQEEGTRSTHSSAGASGISTNPTNRSERGSGTSEACVEEISLPKTKITLAQIRAKKEKTYTESVVENDVAPLTEDHSEDVPSKVSLNLHSFRQRNITT